MQGIVRERNIIVKYYIIYYVLFGVFDQSRKSLLKNNNYLMIFRAGILGNKNDFLLNLG